MQKSTVISTATGTGYTRAARIETAMKNTISTLENSNVPTKVTNDISAITMTSNMDFATGTKPDTTTVTTAVRCALTFMGWTIATIRTDCRVGMRTPTSIPGGDILTWPKTPAIETVFRLDDWIWTGTRTIAQKNTMSTKMQTTDIRKAMATRIATRNYIAGDLCAVTRTPLTENNSR